VPERPFHRRVDAAGQNCRLHVLPRSPTPLPSRGVEDWLISRPLHAKLAIDRHANLLGAPGRYRPDVAKLTYPPTRRTEGRSVLLRERGFALLAELLGTPGPRVVLSEHLAPALFGAAGDGERLFVLPLIQKFGRQVITGQE
jgi:hypothetical protein